MSTEAWIGLASLIVAIVAIIVAIIVRPKEKPLPNPEQQEARQDAIHALNDLETALKGIIAGTPLVRHDLGAEELRRAVGRLENAAKTAPALARSVGMVVPQAYLVVATTSSIMGNNEVAAAMREWARTQGASGLFESGPVLRRLAGCVAVQLVHAIDCEKMVRGAREALTKV
ncbi:hypothetical protein AB0893_26820 [Micromonospora aurantiaca]|uniref:hypothetical protein n=1 Tax=Micromonospora aurantiaca (nom. illeg.) TaxID=47850 RepID=UPI0034538A7D